MSETPRGPITLLREIQQKALSPKNLNGKDRLACVEYLVGEGRSVAEIAELMQVVVRTVQRDLEKIKEHHSITASPDVTRRMIGNLVLDADQGIARLRKIGRDRATPPAAQVDAERAVWQIRTELTERLQSLGILPTAAQEVRADIRHVVTEVPSLQELQKIVATIELTCGPSDGNENVLGKLGAVKGLLAQATAATFLKDLKEEAAGADDAVK